MEPIAPHDRARVKHARACSQSAAFLMAAGEAKATAGAGVAIVSMSARMSNTMNGLARSYTDQVPMLVVSGRQAAANRSSMVRHRLDVEALARQVTKWQVHVASGAVVRRLAKAVVIESTEPSDPGYIDLQAGVGRSPATVGARWQARLRHEGRRQHRGGGSARRWRRG